MLLTLLSNMCFSLPCFSLLYQPIFTVKKQSESQHRIQVLFFYYFARKLEASQSSKSDDKDWSANFKYLPPCQSELLRLKMAHPDGKDNSRPFNFPFWRKMKGIRRIDHLKWKRLLYYNYYSNWCILEMAEWSALLLQKDKSLGCSSLLFPLLQKYYRSLFWVFLSLVKSFKRVFKLFIYHR